MGFVRVKARVWNINKPCDAKEIELFMNTNLIYAVLLIKLLQELGIETIGLGDSG